uniref:Glyoxalase/fosfomycin resistance/dioxygenase domain-containing protein n=1 Tax=Sinocyclocheilus grahami TaxID=75366 RepID=A0A672RVQ1_SINGR
MALRRALHFVFKVGDRTKTATFYRDVLGMKVKELCGSLCSSILGSHSAV